MSSKFWKQVFHPTLPSYMHHMIIYGAPCMNLPN